MQLILLFTIIVQFNFAQSALSRYSVFHQPLSSIHPLHASSSSLLNHPKKPKPLIQKSVYADLHNKFKDYRQRKLNLMNKDFVTSFKEFVGVKRFGLKDPEKLFYTIYGDTTEILQLMRDADPNVDFTVENTNALALEAINQQYYSVLEYLCRWALETSHTDKYYYIYEESKRKGLQLDKIFTLKVLEFANQLKENGLSSGYNLQKGNLRKMSDDLLDAIVSKSGIKLNDLLSSGRFSRDDIIHALFDTIPHHYIMMNSFNPASLIVSNNSPNSIATIMNNGHVQHVLHAKDYSDFFIQLYRLDKLSNIHLNEASQDKIIIGLSMKDEAFVRNLLQSHSYSEEVNQVNALPSFAIDIIMRTGHISRKFIMKCFQYSLKFNLSIRIVNLLENSHVQNLLKDVDFADIFLQAIYYKWSRIEYLRNNQQVKTRIIHGMQSIEDMKLIKIGFFRVILHKMTDAIAIFGDSRILSRKDLLQNLMFHFGFGPFVSRKDYLIQKSILSNQGFLSVLTDADLELILYTAIERKHFGFVLELASNSLFFDRISSNTLEDLMWKTSYGKSEYQSQVSTLFENMHNKRKWRDIL